MNKNINYYQTLGIDKNANSKDIKLAYYKLSFIHHPDKNGDKEVFSLINDAYKVLINKETRSEYDLKSKFGNNYDEYFELFDIADNFDYHKENKKRDDFKKNELIDIYIDIDDTFDGTLEYERWTKCKACDGTGKDLSSKIVIKDKEGNILKVFDAEDGCDFCYGTGKDRYGNDCSFCQGAGKIGMTNCKKCGGEKRILGNQKISGIKLTGELTKLDSMGSCSKNITGMVGNLYLRRKD